ncbi:hypothetical protein F2P81_018935 [Scophthalmus maximus]|uniref:Uncharacterized protein n=1 Tax=Scophthalmus maximus TaxID=52904 RepID=A0A6A4SDG8_SCOMX|nr:hypothetical protein F2P81_018935 [Scophthalmus maximus]
MLSGAVSVNGGRATRPGMGNGGQFQNKKKKNDHCPVVDFHWSEEFFRYDTNNRGSRRAAGPERRVHVNTKCHVHKRYLVQPVRLLARLAKRAQIDLSRRRYSYILRSWRRRHIGGSEEKGRLEA